ncbi:MAG: hypothetical protein JSV91_01220 [Phycisphaerales bacterium]|nr:MAG: hypothetical protein JSV91_01220 [Phycisphaerales bacterium]
MTPRDLVIRTLEFDSPPRVPRQMWLLPWAQLHYPRQAEDIQRRFPDDLVSSPGFWAQPLRATGDRHRRGISVDEWGCTFENIQDGVIGEVKDPVLADWSRLADLRVPVERLTVEVERVNDFCRDTDRFVISAVCPRIFERLQFLRGTENLLCDLLDRPSELTELIGIIHDFHLREFSLWAGTDVDALYIMDDWGAQRSMLISPALWREVFRPLYADYIAIAHNAGKYMFMHSDGYITDIIGDLIELGLNAINSQIFCMGVEELGQRFAGQITFWGELDRQQLLPHGTSDEIIAAASRMKDSLHRDGGLIAQCEFGAGANPDNVRTFFEFWDQPSES